MTTDAVAANETAADLAPAKPLQLPSFAGTYCRNRRIEWWLASATLLEGVFLCVWPHAVKESAFSPLLDIMPADVFAILCVIIGVSRHLALYHSGAWSFWGPVIRAGGALASAVLIFLPLTLSLITLSIESRSTPAVGIPLFLVLFVSEIDTMFRAAADVRSRRLL